MDSSVCTDVCVCVCVCVLLYFNSGKTAVAWPVGDWFRSGALTARRCVTQRRCAHLLCLLSLLKAVCVCVCVCMCVCACVHAGSDLKRRAVFLCRDLASGSVCVVKMNTARLWFASSSLLYSRCCKSLSFSLYCIVSLDPEMMSSASLWYLKSSPQFTFHSRAAPSAFGGKNNAWKQHHLFFFSPSQTQQGVSVIYCSPGLQNFPLGGWNFIWPCLTSASPTIWKYTCTGEQAVLSFNIINI